MVPSISISSEAEATLQAKARAAGLDLASYVATLVEQNGRRPLSLEAISGQVAADFKASGMTEDELGDILEQAKHAMRAERRSRATT